MKAIMIVKCRPFVWSNESETSTRIIEAMKLHPHIVLLFIDEIDNWSEWPINTFILERETQ